MLFCPFAWNIVWDVHLPISTSLVCDLILAQVGPIAICITPPGLKLESFSSLSHESAIVTLTLCQICFSWMFSGTIDFSGSWQASFVSVKPISVGSKSAALLKTSFRRIGSEGSPLIFWRIIRSLSFGLGRTIFGPHVDVGK